MSDVVLYEVSERIATITLNRPEARNALSSAVLRRLPEVLRQADADPDVDVVILTGADPAFCAGLDLKELGSDGGNLGGGQRGEGNGADGNANRDGVRGPFPRMTKPLIGAVNGVAITGGFELALNCDFLVASERAKFGDTHTRVGVMPGWGLTVLLPQAIGVRRAPRGTDPGHPSAGARHHRQRSGRRAADEGHLWRDPRRDRRLAHRGHQRRPVAAGDVQPGQGGRPPPRHPTARPHHVTIVNLRWCRAR
jgi:enoyl-CoA hydratase/carnithine racemase